MPAAWRACIVRGQPAAVQRRGQPREWHGVGRRRKQKEETREERAAWAEEQRRRRERIWAKWDVNEGCEVNPGESEDAREREALLALNALRAANALASTVGALAKEGSGAGRARRKPCNADHRIKSPPVCSNRHTHYLYFWCNTL